MEEQDYERKQLEKIRALQLRMTKQSYAKWAAKMFARHLQRDYEKASVRDGLTLARVYLIDTLTQNKVYCVQMLKNRYLVDKRYVPLAYGRLIERLSPIWR